jgi:hypothetical protein
VATWLYEPDDLLERWDLSEVRLVLSRHAKDLEALSVLKRRERAGELAKLADGVRVSASALAALPERRREILRILAVAMTWTVGGVISHHSAASIHGLPATTPHRDHVHAIVPPASGGRSSGGVRRHAIILHPDEVATVNGLRITDLARTVADLAATLPRGPAVAIADAAMNGRRSAPLTRQELVRQVSRRRDDNARRGVARIEAVAAFADGRAESPKESESRVLIDELGFAAPDLQFEVFDEDGLAGRADFGWRHARVLGEYDGRGKYFDAQLAGGLSPEQVLWNEKRREDRLRAAGFRVVRWGAEDLANPWQLAAKLRRAGVPRS